MKKIIPFLFTAVLLCSLFALRTEKVDAETQTTCDTYVVDVMFTGGFNYAEIPTSGTKVYYCFVTMYNQTGGYGINVDRASLTLNGSYPGVTLEKIGANSFKITISPNAINGTRVYFRADAYSDECSVYGYCPTYLELIALTPYFASVKVAINPNVIQAPYAGQTTTVKVSVIPCDQYGTPLDESYINRTWLKNLPSGVISCTSMGNKTDYLVTFDSTIAGGEYTIEGYASNPSIHAGTAVLTVEREESVFTSVDLTLSRTSVGVPPAGQTSTVRATVKACDQYGTVMSGAQYTLDSSALPQGVTVTGSNGSYTLTLDPTAEAGTYSLIGYATVNSETKDDSAELTIKKDASYLKRAEIILEHSSLIQPPSDAVAYITATVVGYDQYGLPMSGLTTTLKGKAKGLGISGGTDGVYTLTVTSDIMPCERLLSATASDGPRTKTAQCYLTIRPRDSVLAQVDVAVDKGLLGIPSSSKQITKVTLSTSTTVTLTCYDQYGFLIDNRDLNLNVTTTNRGLRIHNDGNGVFTVTVTSSALSGQASLQAVAVQNNRTTVRTGFTITLMQTGKNGMLP